MKTEETNKLIAEFLNELTTNSEGQVKEDLEKLDFHYNWNSLIRAIEKCFKIEANYGLHKNIEDALIGNSENRIQDVYNAVVQFIEVYNESFKQEAVYSIRDNSGVKS